MSRRTRSSALAALVATTRALDPPLPSTAASSSSSAPNATAQLRELHAAAVALQHAIGEFSSKPVATRDGTNTKHPRGATLGVVRQKMEALVARLSHQTNPHERLQVVRADALWLKHDVHSRRGNKGPFKYKGIPELRRLVDAFFARVNASLAGPTSTNDLRMARQALRHELVTNRTSTICGLSVAKPVNGRLPNPMERHVVCDFLAPRGLGPAETAMIGLAKGPRGHRHRSILSNETDAFAAAEAVDLESCPRIAVASLLLDRQAQRLLVLETNRKDVVNVTRLRALDGSNHEAFLKFWRQSRVKLIEGARYTGGWMTSYGAVAATLGHINAMRWQGTTACRTCCGWRTTFYEPCRAEVQRTSIAS